MSCPDMPLEREIVVSVMRYVRALAVWLLCAIVLVAASACGANIAPAASSGNEDEAGYGGLLIRTATPGFAGEFAPTGSQVQDYSYLSVTPNGAPVEVSARLYTPRGKAPAGGWPLVAYAHGTSGVVRHCAPTGFDPVVAPFLEHGFAVASTNYQGLGGPGRHPYIDSASQARDVLYAARASRQTRQDLSNKVVLVGVSQGGRATEAAAEMTSLTPELRVLGNAMGAPALHLGMTQAIEDGTLSHAQLEVLPFLIYAAQQRFPELDYSLFLRGELLEHARMIVDTCSSDLAKVLPPLTAHDAYFASAVAKEQLTRYVSDGNLPWRGHKDIPVMLTRGERDTSVDPSWTDRAVKEMCAMGTTTFDQIRPGDHTDYPEIDIERLGSWVADRFAGRPAPSNCAN
ncbi:lipase family protein [Mycobacteroides abscessus]|uniref:lipase family protein n=2 Tax=Mycobacteroides abscessus TaxID=36809 RepID=UPI001F37F7BF|nr:lipase family protein [Mycobacteroides abscessus]